MTFTSYRFRINSIKSAHQSNNCIYFYGLIQILLSFDLGKYNMTSENKTVAGMRGDEFMPSSDVQTSPLGPPTSPKYILERICNMFGRIFMISPHRPQLRTNGSTKGLASWLRFLFFNFYYFLFILHSILYLLEVFANLTFTTVSRDSSVKNLKSLLFNCRYGFMVAKSAVVFLCFRSKSKR